MDGSINTYCYYFDDWLRSLIAYFQHFNISLQNPASKKISMWNRRLCEDGPIFVQYEELLNFGLLKKNNSLLNFQFWISSDSDISTTVTKRNNLLEISCSLNGCLDYEIDLIELAVNDFIKKNRANFLLKIVDPKGYHEEINWFDVMLTQYNITGKE